MHRFGFVVETVIKYDTRRFYVLVRPAEASIGTAVTGQNPR